MQKHLNIHIHGKVQGVFFRASAQEEARRLHLTGFVRNESDGSVYAEAEGTNENLAAFVAWCHRGPVHARVSKCHAEEGPLVGFREFGITR